jgi:sugar phosphate isomerase/epimerase
MPLKPSVCHYSFHRLWASEAWDCEKLCAEVAAAGSEGVDFHARLTGDPADVPDRIRQALTNTGLTLTGISLGNNFNQPDNAAFAEELATIKRWIDVAAEVDAPASRIFGCGRLAPEERDAGIARTRRGLEEATAYAAEKGVILAIENHGGYPGTGEEQAELIAAINSPHLRATIDVGNYMGHGQEGVDGTRVAAPYAAYVHFKDFIKLPSDAKPWGWDIRACTVGVGHADPAACLDILIAAGYDGWIALEYEGPGDERIGVFESIAFMHRVMKAAQ